MGTSRLANPFLALILVLTLAFMAACVAPETSGKTETGPAVSQPAAAKPIAWEEKWQKTVSEALLRPKVVEAVKAIMKEIQ